MSLYLNSNSAGRYRDSITSVILK